MIAADALVCWVQELERQVDVLESDRVKLMKDLRDNAAQISEKGIKYVGLNADQLLKVRRTCSITTETSYAACST